MYDNVYELCRNVEREMNMFSKELQILDENTVQYMKDEMQDEIDGLNEKLEEENSYKNILTEDKAVGFNL